MHSVRLTRACLATLTLGVACFNPESGGEGNGPDSGSGSGTDVGSATDTGTATTPGTQTATDGTETDPTDASADDPSDTDPTDPDSTGADDSTGEVPAMCGDGIVSAGEFCPVDPPDLVDLGAGAVDVAVADLDDDDALDIALLARMSNTVSVVANDGSGGFGSPLVLDVAEQSCGVVAVDGEGDGDVDLAVAGTTIVTLVSDGAGSFTRIDSEGDNGFFGCDDHNNIDVLNNNGGPLDIVYSGTYNNSYAPGTSAGGWQFGPSIAVDNAGEGSSGVTVTEFAFDADNDPDVVVLNQYFTTASLWAGDGMGAFTEIATIEGCAGVNGASGSRYAAAGDLDGDGSIDLVITCMQGNFAVVRGSADPTFAAPVEVLLPGAHEPTLADVDGDGHLDIVVTSTTQQAVMVYINDGADPDDPIELAVPGTPRGVAIGDLDGDGAVEIVAAVDGGAGSGVAIVRTDP
jgi:hypothetical protein